MPKWNAIEASFLNQSYPQQLGELAASKSVFKILESKKCQP
jgi:hypothetical protein